MSRNYESDPVSFDYLSPFMSSADRAIHEEMCKREDAHFDLALSRARLARMAAMDQIEHGNEEMSEGL